MHGNHFTQPSKEVAAASIKTQQAATERSRTRRAHGLEERGRSLCPRRDVSVPLPLFKVKDRFEAELSPAPAGLSAGGRWRHCIPLDSRVLFKLWAGICAGLTSYIEWVQVQHLPHLAYIAQREPMTSIRPADLEC